MTSRTRPRAAVAAAVAGLVLGLAAAPAAGSEAGGAPGSADTTRPGDAVTLTPGSGPAGTAVSVRAECVSDTAADGAVFSKAFAQPAGLHPAPGGGAMVAEATVRHGLRPGRGYVVTANCGAAESLTTTFVVPGSEPGTAAGLGPAAARGAPAGGPVDGVALAFGGTLAGAALAGYVLIARRTAARRRLRGTAAPRRR